MENTKHCSWKTNKQLLGAIALSYPPPLLLLMTHNEKKNAAESFTVALTLTLGGYQSAIVPSIVDCA